MSADDLLRLAERVEAAEGPDRELDREICLALRSGRWISPGAVPAYTSSLDAAMTLVPEGCGIAIFWFSLDRIAEAQVGGDRKMKGATTALALTAAALRARASSSELS